MERWVGGYARQAPRECPTTIWLRARAKLVNRSGGGLLNPVAMRRALGHACSPPRSTDCPDNAAALLIAAGSNPQLLRSEAAFVAI